MQGAILTAACVDNWLIDRTTELEGVMCDYIYLKRDRQERYPHSGTLSLGEFSELFPKQLVS